MKPFWYSICAFNNKQYCMSMTHSQSSTRTKWNFVVCKSCFVSQYVCASWEELQGNWFPLVLDKICMTTKGIKRIDLLNNAGALPRGQPACFTYKAYSFVLNANLKFCKCIFFFSLRRETLLLASQFLLCEAPEMNTGSNHSLIPHVINDGLRSLAR